MENQQDAIALIGPTGGDAEPATTLLKKPYIAPRLEVLDIEATRNGPGAFPDAGIDFS